ncbi:MAG TPA: hypothetical protein VF039_13065 [Longimicrobiales bacterium]
MLRITIACALLFASAAPTRAQFRHEATPARASVDWTSQNEFGMEPYVGVFLDGMVEGNGREMGPLLGVRLSFEPMYRLRLQVDVGYSEVNGVGAVTSDGSTFTYGNDWIFTLGGVEFDVVPGNTAGMITLAGGVAWRQTESERRILGTGDHPDLGGFTSMVVVAPGVALAHALSPRAAVRVSIQDFIIDVNEDPEHSPAFSLGVVFR